MSIEMSILQKVLLALSMFSYGSAIATLFISVAIDKCNETSTNLIITFVISGFFFLLAVGIVDIFQ